MILFVDTYTNRFVSDPLHKVPVDAVAFKRGDAASIELRFVEGNTVTPLEVGASIAFGLKASGKYDGDFLVFTDEAVASGSGYLIAPSFNTVALDSELNKDGNPANDVSSIQAMLELTWSEDGENWQSTDTIVATIANDVIRGEEGTPAALPDPANWLAEHGITYDSSITGLDGGGSGMLNGVPTVDLPVGTLRAVHLTGGLLIYRLTEGYAPHSLPSRVSPDDMDFGNNQKVWQLVDLTVKSLDSIGAVASSQLQVKNSTDSARASFKASNLSANLTLEVPAFSGTRTICAVSTYTNDAAAASGGLSIGDLYYSTATSRFRIRSV